VVRAEEHSLAFGFYHYHLYLYSALVPGERNSNSTPAQSATVSSNWRPPQSSSEFLYCLKLEMKRFISIAIIIFYSTILFGQSNSENNDTCDNFIYFEKSNEELQKYIDNPCPNDSTCLKEITKAKSEIQKGKITFCMPRGMAMTELRQEMELRKLCADKGYLAASLIVGRQKAVMEFIWIK
jgi:hypothetical protein